MKELIEKFTGKSQVDVTNVKDMDSHDVEENDEMGAYQEIDNMLKEKSIRIWDMPKGMHFVSYRIESNMQQADVYYEYKGKNIRYEIYMNRTDSSRGVTKEDEVIDKYELEVQGNIINVEQRSTKETNSNVMTAEFEYNGVFYQLRGKLEKAEFNKILENLKFY